MKIFCSLFLTTLTLIISTILTDVSGLKDVKVKIPAAVQSGQTATLECEYDLEGKSLYSVKWYRGFREFYRYVPKEIPPTKVFPYKGINVDLSESNARSISLRDVQVSLSGNFSCEVSADAPHFTTVYKSQYMTVVDPPEKLPEIIVEKGSMQGQILSANCTSSKSRPPANLTFYINDVPVPDKYLTSSIIKNTTEYDKHGGSSWLSIHAPIPHQAGPLRLKCVASVLMFHSHAEYLVKEERPELLVLSAREQPGPSSSSKQADVMIILDIMALLFTYMMSYSR